MPISRVVRLSLGCVSVLFLGAACGAGQSQNRPAQHWIKLSTPNFELYTDVRGPKANDLLSLFEEADRAAMRPADARHGSEKPLRIIAFATGEEYVPFRLKAGAIGHYLHAANRDYIVLADAEPEHYEAAVHEYTHYAVHRANLHLPLWLNEGIADLYSTTAEKTGTPALGAPLSGRLSTLAGNRLLPLRDVFAAERTSSLYNDGQSTQVFYAESWAFTRLLALDGRYAAQFPEFLRQVSAGRSAPEALASLYGMTPEQFDAELPVSIRQAMSTRPKAPAQKMESIQPEQTTVSEFEQRIVWADLLAAHPATSAKGKDLLIELEKEHPGDARAEELLGHIAWSAKRSDEARTHWTNAVKGGSQDFETLYRLALLLHASGMEPSQVIDLLEKAVAVNPESGDAIYNLGILKYEEGEYAAASQTLLRLGQLAPERAYNYYSVLAYCEMKTKNFDRAKAFLRKAAESARTPEQQAENSQMLQFATVRAD